MPNIFDKIFQNHNISPRYGISMWYYTYLVFLSFKQKWESWILITSFLIELSGATYSMVLPYVIRRLLVEQNLGSPRGPAKKDNNHALTEKNGEKLILLKFCSIGPLSLRGVSPICQKCSIFIASTTTTSTSTSTFLHQAKPVIWQALDLLWIMSVCTAANSLSTIL
jgi:hypothetical protein